MLNALLQEAKTEKYTSGIDDMDNRSASISL